jgi:hypothetical protein
VAGLPVILVRLFMFEFVVIEILSSLQEVGPQRGRRVRI